MSVYHYLVFSSRCSINWLYSLFQFLLSILFGFPVFFSISSFGNLSADMLSLVVQSGKGSVLLLRNTVGLLPFHNATPKIIVSVILLSSQHVVIMFPIIFLTIIQI